MNKIKSYCFIVYSEDVHIDTLVNVLETYGYPYAISPLHDKDVFTQGKEKGVFKKPHYHVMVQSGRLKESVRKRINISLGVRENMPWIEVRNEQHMYEYFFHKNDIYKAQYSEDDMIISDKLDMNFSNPTTKSTLKTVIDIIENEHLDTYYKMARYFLNYPDNDVTEWCFRNDAKLRTYIFFMTGGNHKEDV